MQSEKTATRGSLVGRVVNARFEFWPEPPTPVVPTGDRWVASLIVAVLAFAVCTYFQGGRGANDFSWPLEGMRQILAGVDPYPDYYVGPVPAPIYYPIPALWMAAPFLPLPRELAGPAFLAVSCGLLAFGLLSRFGWIALLTLLSPPCLVALYLGQLSPITMAALVLPWLAAPILLAKPTLGLALLAAFPTTKRVLAIGAALVGIGVYTALLYPAWLPQWVHNVSLGHHLPPIMLFPPLSTLLLLCVLHLRIPSARLLLLLSVAPQNFAFYDQIVLFMIPRSTRQYVYLFVASWLCYLVWQHVVWWVLPSGNIARSAVFWNVVLYVAALVLVVLQGHGRIKRGLTESVSVPEWLARARRQATGARAT